MKIFVWDSLEVISERYHSGGGLLIVSESMESARTEWSDYAAKNNVGSYDGHKPSELGEPSHQWSTDATERKIIVFPDAGCC